MHGHAGSSQIRARTHVVGIGSLIGNHWTTGEVPLSFFFFNSKMGPTLFGILLFFTSFILETCLSQHTQVNAPPSLSGGFRCRVTPEWLLTPGHPELET